MTLSNFMFDTLVDRMVYTRFQDSEFLPTAEWIGNVYDEYDEGEGEWERLPAQDQDQVVQELMEALESALMAESDRLSFSTYAYR